MPNWKEAAQNFKEAWKKPAWRWALGIALVSDALGFGVSLFPPLQWALDGLTAVALFVALGFRWALLPALAIEAVPALELFPAWTLAVAALAALEKEENGTGA